MIKSILVNAEKAEKIIDSYNKNESSSKIQAALEMQLDQIAAEMPSLAHELFGTLDCTEYEKITSIPFIGILEVREGIRYMRSLNDGEKLSQLSWVITHDICSESYWMKSWDTDNSQLFRAIETKIASLSDKFSDKLRIQKTRLFEKE